MKFLIYTSSRSFNKSFELRLRFSVLSDADKNSNAKRAQVIILNIEKVKDIAEISVNNVCSVIFSDVYNYSSFLLIKSN